VRYPVQQRICSLRELLITDEDGSEVLQVDAQALQFRKIFEVKDRVGAVW
jgi:uncharacterized protein YxjI